MLIAHTLKTMILLVLFSSLKLLKFGDFLLEINYLGCLGIGYPFTAALMMMTVSCSDADINWQSYV